MGCTPSKVEAEQASGPEATNAGDPKKGSQNALGSKEPLPAIKSSKEGPTAFVIPKEEGAEPVPLQKNSLPKLDTTSSSGSKNGSQADGLNKMVLSLDENKVKIARAKSAAARADPEAMRRRQEEREAAVAANKQREQEEREAKQKQRDEKAEKVRAAKAANAGKSSENLDASLTSEEAQVAGTSSQAA